MTLNFSYGIANKLKIGMPIQWIKERNDHAQKYDAFLQISPVNKLMVSLDQASGYGQQLQDEKSWKLDGQKTITSRESM